MDGRVFGADDPIWKSHYPLNGFNCRCSVSALTAADLEEEGLTVYDSEGRLTQLEQEMGMDKRTGEVIKTQGTSYSFTTPDGKRHINTPDPGWNCNPAHFGPEFDLLSTLERTLKMLEIVQPHH